MTEIYLVLLEIYTSKKLMIPYENKSKIWNKKFVYLTFEIMNFETTFNSVHVYE